MSPKTKEEVASKEVEVLTKNAGDGALMVMDFSQDVGAGFEETDQSSYAIPYIKLLQSMSKQCKKLDGNYVKGAEEGMYWNSVTNELYDGQVGFPFIPCHYRRKFIEYTGTQDEKGVYVKEYSAIEGEKILATCVPDAKNNQRIPNTTGPSGAGHILNDVREHYVLFIHPVTFAPMPVVISLASSQIKTSKLFMARAGQLKRNPMQKAADACFSHVFHMSSIPQVKDTFSYFGNKMEHVAAIEAAGASITALATPEVQMYLYKEAKAFNELVRSGKAEVDKNFYQGEAAEDVSGDETVAGDKW